MAPSEYLKHRLICLNHLIKTSAEDQIIALKKDFKVPQFLSPSHGRFLYDYSIARWLVIKSDRARKDGIDEL